MLDEHPHLNYTMRLELDHAPEIGRRRAENEISAAHWISGMVAYGNYFFIFLATEVKVGGISLL